MGTFKYVLYGGEIGPIKSENGLAYIYLHRDILAADRGEFWNELMRNPFSLDSQRDMPHHIIFLKKS